MQADVGERPCPATRQMLLSEAQLTHKAKGPSLSPFEVLSSPLASHPRTHVFQATQEGEVRGKVITMVQLAHCHPSCLQTGATSPRATEANIFSYLHLCFPRPLEEASHSQQLTGQLPFLYFAGAFR